MGFNIFPTEVILSGLRGWICSLFHSILLRASEPPPKNCPHNRPWLQEETPVGGWCERLLGWYMYIRWKAIATEYEGHGNVKTAIKP